MAKAPQISRDSVWTPWPELTAAWRQSLTGPKNHLDIRPLIEPAEYLWLTYTRQQLERRWAQRMEKTDEMTLARAYVLGFHLANAARAALPLLRLGQALSEFVATQKATSWRMIDIGSGSGAGVQAAALALAKSSSQKMQFSFHLYDQSAELLALAQAMLTKLKLLPAEAMQLQLGSGDLFKRIQDLGRDNTATNADSNFVNLGYVWNEIQSHRPAREEMISTLKLLSQSNYGRTWLMISEPASEVPSREAMSLRDDLCQMGWSPLYPCPGHERCPMLAAGRDWCFSEMSVKFPQEMQALDRAMGRNQSTIGTSVYLFTNRPNEHRTSLQTARVVGRPSAGRKAWLLVCDANGLTRVPHPPLALRKWSQKNPRGSAYLKRRRSSRFARS